MVTYKYQCEKCGFQFEIRQAITEKPIDECPECKGKVNLMVSGGSGFMIKGGSQGAQESNRDSCSFESSGTTCCGRQERCGKPAYA